MKDFLEALKNEMNVTETENGAGAYKSTMCALLDAFGSLGAMRNFPESVIISTFSKAFAENKRLAIRMWFYMRDVRGGQGMRKVFRVIAEWLANNYPEYVVNNLDNFLEYGRGDDIICLMNTPIKDKVVAWANNQLNKDLGSMLAQKPCSMLAKWMPSENASSQATRKAAREFIFASKLRPAKYRKILSNLRRYIDVVERKMSAKKWADISYDKVPSKASIKYIEAFARNDQERYLGYISDLANGQTKVNAGAIFPVDIIHNVLRIKKGNVSKISLYDAMWKALPDYCAGHEETGICVVDTSGSMEGTPIEVAISLGMYCADKCRGPFAGHFITFSNYPELQKIVGDNIYQKVKNLSTADWDMSTNLESVFDLILKTGKDNNVADSDMPKKLYIISDMQFNSVMDEEVNGTLMDSMRRKYEEAGYTMPIIVYWNVRASKAGMFQQKIGDEQCCMVSGYSPSLFKSIVEGTIKEVETKDDGTEVVHEKVDPITVMLTVLNSARYAPIWIG